jgi:hypothetical protein
MIPFATWSQSRNEIEIAIGQHAAQGYERSESDTDLSNLMSAMVEGLMTASVVQLRSIVEHSDRRRSDEQAYRQENYISQELLKIEERIMSAVADVLIPVLHDLQLRDVMRTFADTLKKLLPEFGVKNLIIKAPENIHGMLNEALRKQDIIADIAHSDDNDIAISGNQVVLVASLDAWSQKLKSMAA